MSETTRDLPADERAACLIAERVLGATAIPWDVDGRQGAVDAMLILPSGKRAAFEVTKLAADGALQIDSILGRDNHAWPAPGRWWWSIEIGSPYDIPRLRKCYARLALLCEQYNVNSPYALWRANYEDPDLSWLIEDSTSDMHGYPSVPAVEGNLKRDVMVVPSGRGGGVDRSLNGLRSALDEAFLRPHMNKHLDKIARAEADERHLFVPLHFTALPFNVAYGLMEGDALPTTPPPLPISVTHLWLAPQFAQRVLLWTPDGWQQHYPYDNPHDRDE
ncbi:hypothetical protein [Streptomyces sp. NPDC014995]|uniref:hypothetical protein n=1 Tax=Streptomyces sp. NPDC014995 TaxID=3364936 RepID=UPI0036FE52F3